MAGTHGFRASSSACCAGSGPIRCGPPAPCDTARYSGCRAPVQRCRSTIERLVLDAPMTRLPRCSRCSARRRAAGRSSPAGSMASHRRALAQCLEWLRAARYGVAIWAAARSGICARRARPAGAVAGCCARSTSSGALPGCRWRGRNGGSHRQCRAHLAVAASPYPASHANGSDRLRSPPLRCAGGAGTRRGRLPAVDLEPVRRPARLRFDGPAIVLGRADSSSRASPTCSSRWPRPASTPTVTCSAATRSSACTCRACAAALCRRVAQAATANREGAGAAACTPPAVVGYAIRDRADPLVCQATRRHASIDLRLPIAGQSRWQRRCAICTSATAASSDGPRDGERIDRSYDVSGQIVMAGGIDLHTHIGGGKVNLARADAARGRTARDVLPRYRRCAQRASAAAAARRRSPPATAMPRWATPRRSSRRCCRPTRARRTWRWATCRSLDKGAYVLLGNDDLFLRCWSGRAPAQRRRSATTSPGPCSATQAMAIKVVNPAGISAFKFNSRKLDVDEAHVHWQITPRTGDAPRWRARCTSSACRTRCTSTAATSACAGNIATHAGHHRRARRPAAST